MTIEQFRKEKFDLGISEHIDPCGLAYFEKINVEKYISADSLCLNEDVTIPLGIDSNPSFVPSKPYNVFVISVSVIKLCTSYFQMNSYILIQRLFR